MSEYLFELKPLEELKPRFNYLRTTWLFSSQTELRFPDTSKIRFFSEKEADRLVEQMRKDNLLVRRFQDENFYVQQVKKLADCAVIEISLLGCLEEVSEKAGDMANLQEKLAIFSSSFTLDRTHLHREIGISSNPNPEVKFIRDAKFKSLSSKSRLTSVPKGVIIDERFCRRFSRCGFEQLYSYCLLMLLRVEKLNEVPYLSLAVEKSRFQPEPKIKIQS